MFVFCGARHNKFLKIKNEQKKILQKLLFYSVKELDNIWKGALSLIGHHIASSGTKHFKGKPGHPLGRCARLAQREQQANRDSQRLWKRRTELWKADFNKTLKNFQWRTSAFSLGTGRNRSFSGKAEVEQLQQSSLTLCLRPEGLQSQTGPALGGRDLDNLPD